MPDSIIRWIVHFFQIFQRKDPEFVEGIIDFYRGGPKLRNALLSLSPSAWLVSKKEGRNIRFFNIVGLTLKVVKALNERGYSVDIVDCLNKGFIPKKKYDLFLGHGGNCKDIIENLSKGSFILHYASGAYWKEFKRESQERYDAFFNRRGLPPTRKFVRSLDGLEIGEEHLAANAHATFLSGPRTVATFKDVCKKIFLLYLGSYIDNGLASIEKDFESGKKNFIYVAGTSGNIQKGMDLLLECFARLPHLNLYIYCKVEDEILSAYKKELRLPNIHYVYHYRMKPFKNKLVNLLRVTNFTISAAINTGPGTAFVGSLGLGLIPVGYVDIEGDENDSCLAGSWSIDELERVIRLASEKSVEWCQMASRLNKEKYDLRHHPDAFEKNFNKMLDELHL